jgi:hypothetical protein
MTNVQGQPQTASTGGLFAIYADQYARSITLRFSSLLRDFGRRSVNPDQPICGFQRSSLAHGSFRWSQKSYAAASH